MAQSLEEILGKIDHERPVPGTRPGEGEKVRYVSFDDTKNPSDLFETVVWHLTPPLPQSGGVNLANFVMRLPDGTAFYPLKYHGDLRGWQEQIEQGASSLGLLTAKFEAGAFAVSDGRTFSLAECISERTAFPD